METYIMFNTNMRKGAKNTFEKDLFKLMNNAVFGKTMENVRLHKDIELVTDEERLKKLTANPRYLRESVFSKDLVAIHKAKREVVLNKPIYIGFSVLDLSKLLMYDFHYNYISPKYGNEAKLLFTDTDSLCYLFRTDDIYKDMTKDGHLYDFSDYPKVSGMFSEVNKKVLGKMKDETAGVPIQEFVGLRAKVYSILYNGEEMKRAKGIKKYVVKKYLRHQNYKDILNQSTLMHSEMNMFRSQGHKIATINVNKISLSAYDDKRYILDDGITSLAYGHCNSLGFSDDDL